MWVYIICILQERKFLTRTNLKFSNFQSFVLHLDEAVYKPLPLSDWTKQLPPYEIGCKTQIALIFKNIFKAANFSCYLIDTKNYLFTK